MSLPGSTIEIPKFDNTLGAILIGGMVAMALWGITCVQSYTFLTYNSQDRPRLRILVIFLWVLDTFDSVLNCHMLYFYMVSNYLNPLALLVPVWSVIIHVAITSISNFIIRCLFAHRVYKLSHGSVLTTLGIMAISTTDLVTGIVISAKAFSISSYADLDHISNLMYLSFAAGTGSDLSVAVSLCYHLHRSRTGFERTDGIIKILMQYTVNTGLLVAIDAAAGMICYILMPHNLIFLGFYLLLSKLYLNSYLASLNARDSLREKLDQPVSLRLSHLSSARFTSMQSQDMASMSFPTTAAEKTLRTEDSMVSIA